MAPNPSPSSDEIKQSLKETFSPDGSNWTPEEEVDQDLSEQEDDSPTPEGIIRDEGLQIKLHSYKGMAILEFSRPVQQLALSTHQIRTLKKGLKKVERVAIRQKVK